MMAASISEPAISPIRAVMLDYGEVLCFLPAPDAIARMARIFRIDPGAFLPIYTQSRGPYDRGDLSPEEYWHAFASQAGVTLDGDLIEELRRWDVEMWSRTNDPMILWLESLHAAGLKTDDSSVREGEHSAQGDESQAGRGLHVIPPSLRQAIVATVHCPA